MENHTYGINIYYLEISIDNIVFSLKKYSLPGWAHVATSTCRGAVK